MSIQYIRDYYKVPAKVGGQVIYSGDQFPRTGKIIGTDGPHLRIRLDGDKHPQNFHPTWELKYVEPTA